MTNNQGDFLADPTNPALTSAAMERIGDPSRPDRLAWNTFRTLALWEPDRWVPSLLEIGLGPSNRLSGHEWDGTSVQLWATGLDLDGAVDVILDGPEALVLIEAALDSSPPQSSNSRLPVVRNQRQRGGSQVCGGRIGDFCGQFQTEPFGVTRGKAERCDGQQQRRDPIG